VVGTIIGSGIFLVPSDMVRAVGSPAMVFAVWLFGGVLTLAGALSFAELASAMPEAGGPYAYLKSAYGPFLGFVFAWTWTWAVEPASLAGLATAFYTYLAEFFPQLQTVFWTVPLPIGSGGDPLPLRYGQLLAIAMLVVVSGVNYVGARAGGRVQVALTSLKLGLLGSIVAAGLFWGQASAGNLAATAEAQPGGIAGFFVALVAALWAYDGWANASLLGSEIERPERNLPLALILGTAATIGVYALTNLAYFLVLSGAEVGGSSRVAADMMRRVAGDKGAALVSVAAMVSIFAALNGSMLANSRVPYAAARDGLLFRRIARVHPRFRTPAGSILVLGAWSSVLVLSGQYQQLYTLVIFPAWILYGMTAAAVVVLRRRRPELPRPYRVWAYPAVPAAFGLVALALLFSTIRTSPRESGIGLAVILAGLPFYFHWKGQKRG
jgi:APA family basic amino acid/polyamine antiporter